MAEQTLKEHADEHGDGLIHVAETTDVILLEREDGAIAYTLLSDLIAEAMIRANAISTIKILDAAITKAKLYSDVFESVADIETGTATDEAVTAAGLKHSSGLARYLNGTAAGSNITEILASHAGLSLDIDQNTTLDKAFGAGLAAGVGLWVKVVNTHATLARTLTVEAGAGGTGTINGATSVSIPAGGTLVVQSLSNAGDQPICRADGDTAEIDFGGKIVSGNLVSVVTGVSGTLTTAAHLGRTVVTTGNITVPTTTGFHCYVIAGGAHTITFNSTVTAAAASGQMCSVMVQSGTVVKVTPWLTTQTLA